MESYIGFTIRNNLNDNQETKGQFHLITTAKKNFSSGHKTNEKFYHSLTSGKR